MTPYDPRSLDDRIAHELRRAEFVLRSMRNSTMIAKARLGPENPSRVESPSGRIEDWDAAIPHLDAAVRELEEVFAALGIERVVVDPDALERAWDEASEEEGSE